MTSAGTSVEGVNVRSEVTYIVLMVNKPTDYTML